MAEINRNSEDNKTMEDINKIIAQRDQLQKILIQRDITIERLLKKSDTLATTLIPQNKLNEKTGSDAQFINESVHERIRNESPAKIKCEHLSLECCLLKDLNRSLENENENLKTVNEIWQNNFAIINGRLNRIQSEHKERLTQLHEVNQLLKKSIRSKKRSRSLSTESQNKRRRFNKYFEGDGMENGQKVDSGSVKDSEDEMDEVDESDNAEDSDEENTSSSDVVFVETEGDNIIHLIDDSDADIDDSKSEKEIVRSQQSNHSDRSNGLNDDDDIAARNSIEPLTQCRADAKFEEATNGLQIQDE